GRVVRGVLLAVSDQASHAGRSRYAVGIVALMTLGQRIAPRPPAGCPAWPRTACRVPQKMSRDNALLKFPHSSYKTRLVFLFRSGCGDPRLRTVLPRLGPRKPIFLMVLRDGTDPSPSNFVCHPSG